MKLKGNKEYTVCVNSTVVISNLNGPICLSLDPRELNNTIKRNPYYVLIADDVMLKISDVTHNVLTLLNRYVLLKSAKCQFGFELTAPTHGRGAGRSSEVARSLMVRWVVGSILHGVDPLSYFSFQPVLHDWCNKGRGMCYPVCGMVHIKEPLLLIDKSSLCGGSGFPFSLSEWSLTICLTPYNRR